MAKARLSVSITETLHYQRLVDFVAEVEELADQRGDDDLRRLVDDLRGDLGSLGGRAD